MKKVNFKAEKRENEIMREKNESKTKAVEITTFEFISHQNLQWSRFNIIIATSKIVWDFVIG